MLYPNTVVLGMGLATIVPDNGMVGIQTLDVPGIDIAGLIFDAGPVSSPALLQLGTKISTLDGLGKKQYLSSASNPTAVQDVFFRIGGEHVGKATNSLVVNTNQTIVDHTWAWRADHGDGVGWTVNTADTGVLVNGNDVTATGLFSEHFQKYDVVWNGERGKTIFFQNEMPYDAPNQAAWQHDGLLGYAAYKVNDKVKTHEAWGLGSYIYTNVDPTLHATQAFEVPNTPGVRLHDLADRLAERAPARSTTWSTASATPSRRRSRARRPSSSTRDAVAPPIVPRQPAPTSNARARGRTSVPGVAASRRRARPHRRGRDSPSTSSGAGHDFDRESRLRRGWGCGGPRNSVGCRVEGRAGRST